MLYYRVAPINYVALFTLLGKLFAKVGNSCNSGVLAFRDCDRGIIRKVQDRLRSVEMMCEGSKPNVDGSVVGHPNLGNQKYLADKSENFMRISRCLKSSLD